MASAEPAADRAKKPPDPQTPLFNRYYELLVWLTTRTKGFPREYRFVLGQRILETAYTCYRYLIRAKKVSDAARSAALLEADILLDVLRAEIRMAHELRCLSVEQYAQGAGLVNEVGRMLGTWRSPSG